MKTKTNLAASLASLLLGGVFWFGPAHAQVGGDMGGRLERLESQLGLSTQVAESVQVAQAGGMAPSLAADFEIRLQRLERTVSELTGRYEESTHHVGQLKDRLERLNADIDFRIQQLEKAGGGAAGAGAAAPVAAMPNAPARTAEKPAGPANGQLGSTKPSEKLPEKAQVAAPPPGANPDKQYEHAFELLRTGNYDQAEKEFSTFVAKNKTHTLAGSAQYWLGESYYVRNRFGEAAASFGEVLQKYPKGNKAPDALLKLGLSLASLNKKTEACTALGQLNKMYPEAAPSVKRRSETERRKLNCN